ncbi:acyl-homoserine-lactone synthase [Alisedimentitalea sp. MJ-SS2]|uniref:acyl-homoserine-lactone synthase n=1 Tax=Aliisedimentitalea sp. MJ-SS2 TaxID=3049795 RepID=UPI0029138F81|nr:acyl-homoserine-lactone synthase [Alisedimentitalea sp. MJ-SS2]MDU8928777.1 acyl-homoserine-lactone synthase [Alisedimentitalea sp. MJ-SS2]
MLRFIYANDLGVFPKLADTMFRDRAAQFRERLGWDVTVDTQGHERDEYDNENPLYVIWQNADGGHGGSFRLLPTTGPTMVNDHFTHLMNGRRVESPLIWECTRFCLEKGSGPRVAAALMLGGGGIMERFEIEHFIGVFDAPMTRIYSRIGSAPTVLGAVGQGRAKTSVGLWSFSNDARARVARSAGLSPALIRLWLDRCFGREIQARKSA